MDDREPFNEMYIMTFWRYSSWWSYSTVTVQYSMEVLYGRPVWAQQGRDRTFMHIQQYVVCVVCISYFSHLMTGQLPCCCYCIAAGATAVESVVVLYQDSVPVDQDSPIRLFSDCRFWSALIRMSEKKETSWSLLSLNSCTIACKLQLAGSRYYEAVTSMENAS